METKLCSKCGKVKPLTEFYQDKKGRDAGRYRSYCILCNTLYHKAYYLKHLAEKTEPDSWSHYLGITIAETIISEYFSNIERMPPGNEGYDFICNRGFKIDVKASCLTNINNRSPFWFFNIKKNALADYFVLIAFDNKESLDPSHIWLIPSQLINHLTGLRIRNTAYPLSKWQPYEKPLDKVIHCCNLLRDTEEIIYF